MNYLKGIARDSVGQVAATLVLVWILAFALAGCTGSATKLGDVDITQGCTIFGRQGSVSGRWTSTDYEGFALSVLGSCPGVDLSDFEISFDGDTFTVKPAANSGKAQ